MKGIYIENIEYYEGENGEKKERVKKELIEVDELIKDEKNQKVIGIKDGRVIVEFHGVSNFDTIEKVGDWDLPKELKQDLATAEMFENLQEENLRLSLALAEMYEELTKLKGGETE